MFVQNETIDWGVRSLGAASRSRLKCGPLLVEFSRGNDEVCLASKTLSDEEAISGFEADTPVSWTSWAVCTGARGVKVLPGLPDLPVLAPQVPAFEVAPGAETRVYLRIPVSVLVKLADRDEDLLAEFPSELLPKVWFGEADKALRCYRLNSSASREIICDLDSAEIQAPVLIRNESRETLTVTQICLRVGLLGVYRSGSSLWASETLVCYQGGVSPSRITAKSGPPAEAPEAKLMAAPRETAPETLVGRTFRSFRRWTLGVF
ncbi:MAG: hypothetical protein ABL994_12035 [Verrucomicrobiales bacterium]